MPRRNTYYALPPRPTPAPVMAPTANDPRIGAKDITPPDFSERLVEVLVGEDEAKVTLHENCLKVNSKFFEAALSRDWKEAVERKVKLPEEEPSYFKVYASWVYTRRIHADHLTGEATSGVEFKYAALFKLYGMGARMQDSAFQDAILDTCISQQYTSTSTGTLYFPSVADFRSVYKDTLPGDAARRLVVDSYVKHGNESWYKDSKDPEDRAFTTELVHALFRYKANHVTPTIISSTTGTCAYHQHGEGLCYNRKRTKDQTK